MWQTPWPPLILWGDKSFDGPGLPQLKVLPGHLHISTLYYMFDVGGLWRTGGLSLSLRPIPESSIPGQSSRPCSPPHASCPLPPPPSSNCATDHSQPCPLDYRPLTLSQDKHICLCQTHRVILSCSVSDTGLDT